MSTCSTRPRADARLHAGRNDDERHARAFLEKRLLRPQAVLAELVAVVAGEQNDRVFIEVQFLESREHAADLRIHPRGRGVIGAAGFASLVRCRAAKRKTLLFGRNAALGMCARFSPSG